MPSVDHEQTETLPLGRDLAGRDRSTTAAAQLFSATSQLRLEAWISTESVAVHSLMERIERQPDVVHVASKFGAFTQTETKHRHDSSRVVEKELSKFWATRPLSRLTNQRWPFLTRHLSAARVISGIMVNIQVIHR